MKTYLVVTIACPDRPGIVEKITEVIEGFSANWEESRMSRLGGDFAGIVRISVSQEKAEPLATALQALTDEEMTVTVKTTRPVEAEAQPRYSLYELRLTGADHEGIVHQVAGYLAERGINVENMETEVVHAPISATPLFHMEAQIKVPAELPLAELNANLRRIGDQLGVDVQVSEARQA
jgi:glycine cleavage system regulatory protein